VFGNDFSEALSPIDSHPGAGHAGQFEDIQLALGVFHKPPGRPPPLLDEIRTDDSNVQGTVGHIHPAVGQDDRYARGLYLLQNGLPPGRHYRCECDDIDLLLDKRPQGLDLVFLFLLGVCQAQIYTSPPGFALD